MNRQIPSWDICLESPPEIIEIGRNAHGFSRLDRFTLPDLWALHIYGYEANIRIGENDLAVQPGYAGITPPGAPVEYRYQGISVHVYAHFKLSCAGNGEHKIPAVQDLEQDYERYYQRLYELVDFPANQQARARARVWDILFDLVDRGGTSTAAKRLHPAVNRAVSLIRQNLDAPLVVEDLAKEVGVSYSYLARLFHTEFGMTVIAYIHERRLERALQLLERSTLPIKTVASSVGISDPHHFNKTVRQRFGLSPRKVRLRFLETHRSIASDGTSGTLGD